MPQSLANIPVHLVFSTKEPAPLLDDAWRDDWHGCIDGIIRRRGDDLLAANSVAGRIDLFVPLPRAISGADLVKEIKTGATKWIHEKGPHHAGFHWQAGHGIFSVSPGHQEAVISLPIPSRPRAFNRATRGQISGVPVTLAPWADGSNRPRPSCRPRPSGPWP